ncbi:MAG TPA: isochorismatase family protein [Xanthomonadaceae bacterium]
MTIPRIAGYPMPHAHDLPDNRVAWTPDPARAVLLLHDIQAYFLDFYDRAQSPVPEMVRNVLAIREACDTRGVPVIYSRQPEVQSPEQRGLLQPWWGPGVTAQPERAGIDVAVAPRDIDRVLTKWRYSAFVSTGLRELMREAGRDQIIVCGVYAHIGVQTTAADAFMHDIQPFVIGDAVADFSPEEHDQALRWIAGRCGVVMDHRRCIESLHEPGGLPASLDALREALARAVDLPVEEVSADDNPLYLGLDSIRLMALLERWTRDGATLGFVDLAERATIGEWWALIASQRDATSRVSEATA